MTLAGSEEPNTELPATMQFAPAFDAASIVAPGANPPSTFNANISIALQKLGGRIHKHIHATEIQPRSL